MTDTPRRKKGLVRKRPVDMLWAEHATPSWEETDEEDSENRTSRAFEQRIVNRLPKYMKKRAFNTRPEWRRRQSVRADATQASFSLHKECSMVPTPMKERPHVGVDPT